MDIKDLKEKLKERFGGVLRGGSHKIPGPNERECEVCAVEFINACKGIKKRPWVPAEYSAMQDESGAEFDAPTVHNVPDMRNLNDSFKTNETRTKYMLPIIAEVWDADQWPRAKAEAVKEAFEMAEGAPNAVERAEVALKMIREVKKELGLK